LLSVNLIESKGFDQRKASEINYASSHSSFVRMCTVPSEKSFVNISVFKRHQQTVTFDDVISKTLFK